VNIVTFINSWKGHSWAKQLANKDQTPVFWTKDTTKNNDTMDKAFLAYSSKFPGVSVRLAYDEVNSVDDVVNAWKKFKKSNANAPVVHLWTQGTIEGKGPAEMARLLRVS
jgi:hypothetical protein